MERHKGATRHIGGACIEQIKFYGNLLPLAAYRHSAPEKKGIVLAFMPENAAMLLRESNPDKDVGNPKIKPICEPQRLNE